MQRTRCPGCGLEMPKGASPYDGYYHASDECWSLFGEVIGVEFSNAVLFGAVHQLTVDAYAVQHAGGNHPDKSVTVHLVGLYLALEAGIPVWQVAGRLQRLAEGRRVWPTWTPPEVRWPMNILSVALSDDLSQHRHRVLTWSAIVWESWSHHHDEIRGFYEDCCLAGDAG